MSNDALNEPLDEGAAADYRYEDQEADDDAQWHIRDAFLSRLPALKDSPLAYPCLGLLDQIVDLSFKTVLDDDEAIACLRFLLEEDATSQWEERGLFIYLHRRREAVVCKGSGRLTARALNQLLSFTSRYLRHPETFPDKQG